MNVRMWWVFGTVALVFPSVGAAQICTGFAPFTDSPFHISGTAAINDDVKAVGAGLSFGGAGPFGQVSLGSTWYDDIDGHAWSVAGGGGYQFQIDSAGTTVVCPTASVGFASGPNGFDTFGDGSFLVDFTELDLALGVSIGFVAARSGPTPSVVPSISVSFVSATLKAADQTSGVSDTESDSFGVLGLGIGFIINRVTLHPSVSVPVGLANSSPSFSAIVNVGLGSQR